MKGHFKPHSEETKKRISIIKLGKPNNSNTKFKKGNIPWSKGTKGILKVNSGSFKKGHKPWNNGKIYGKMPNEHKKKIIKSLNEFYKLGKIFKYFDKITKQKYVPTMEHRLKVSIGNKGKKMTKEAIEKIRLSKLGKKRPIECIIKRTETRKKNGFWKDRASVIKKRSGEKSHFWNGGSSFEPYDFKFNKELRNNIRQRDNQICMNCGIHREKLNKALDIHHINYNKKCSFEQNLISLCRNCHALTCFNRIYWTKLFQDKLSKLYNYKYDEKFNIILEINK